MHYHPRKPGETPDGGPELPEVHENYGPEARFAVERRGRAADHEVGGGDRPRPGAGPARRRLHRRQADPDVLPRRAAALRRHQHLPQGAVRGGRPPLRRVRRRRARRPVRRRHHLPLRAPASGPQGIRKISALYGPYSFELGVDLRESITIADLGDIFTIPGNIEKTFDQITKAVVARLRLRRLPGRARRRPLDRLPDHARRRPAPERRQPRDHPLRPPRRHPGDRPRRADAHHAVVPRHGHPERPGRRTSSRSASAAGRRRGRA